MTNQQRKKQSLFVRASEDDSKKDRALILSLDPIGSGATRGRSASTRIASISATRKPVSVRTKLRFTIGALVLMVIMTTIQMLTSPSLHNTAETGLNDRHRHELNKMIDSSFRRASIGGGTDSNNPRLGGGTVSQRQMQQESREKAKYMKRQHPENETAAETETKQMSKKIRVAGQSSVVGNNNLYNKLSGRSRIPITNGTNSPIITSEGKRIATVVSEQHEPQHTKQSRRKKKRKTKSSDSIGTSNNLNVTRIRQKLDLIGNVNVGGNREIQRFERPNPNIDIRIQLGGSDMKTVVIQTKDISDGDGTNDEWKDLIPTGSHHSRGAWGASGGARAGSGSSGRRSKFNMQSTYIELDPLNPILAMNDATDVVDVDPKHHPKGSANNTKTIGNQTDQTKWQQIEKGHDDSRYYLPIQPKVEYLGVLIDGGRHYYPMDWLLRLLDYLTLMRYNMIHFRLTDDQAFNVHLKSYPQLAFPSVVLPPSRPPSHNQTSSKSILDDQVSDNKRRGGGRSGKQEPVEEQQHKVYTSNELRYFVQQAKLRNITVIPEVNIPGHAGAWAGIPDLIMQCPNFVCNMGYSVPMNVSHVNISTILHDVLHEIVVDIFDSPPFVHLGGDEVEMGYDCWLEHETNREHNDLQINARNAVIGDGGQASMDGAIREDGHKIVSATSNPYNFYSQFIKFETDILPKIIQKLGYSENQVIRWERKDETMKRQTEPRYGHITQYWQSIPNAEAAGATSSNDKADDDKQTLYAIASTGLYFDLQEDVDGWEYYQRTQNLLRPWLINATTAESNINGNDNKKRSVSFMGVIAGTFELSSDMWLDRNVIGRLLAVAMAVSDPTIPPVEETASTAPESVPISDETDNESIHKVSPYTKVREAYMDNCVAYLNINPVFCELFGQPTLGKWTYSKKWRGVWRQWKDGLCHRLTHEVSERRVQKNWIGSEESFMIKANERYWDWFGRHTAVTAGERASTKTQQKEPNSREDSGDGNANGSSNRTSSHEMLKMLHQHAIAHTGVIFDTIGSMLSVDRIVELFQSDELSSFGFNTVQLKLVNDDAFMVIINALPNLRNTPLSLKPAFREDDLQKFIDAASAAGLQIIPEISITTNVGGWYRGGFLVDCPDMLCRQSGESGTTPVLTEQQPLGVTSHNVTNFSLLPVLLTVIRELKRIFATSEYIHLGSDERLLGLNCALVRKSGLDIKLSDYGRFERKLSKLLTMDGIALDGIVRWNNHENIQYSDRTGSITQYYDNITSAPSDYGKERKVFTVVKLADRGPWTIFQTTRAHARLSPTAIFADVKHADGSKWSSTGTTQRLLAFAMGLANRWTDNMDRDEFETQYVELCRSFKKDVKQCREFVETDSIPDRQLVTEQDHFLNHKCEQRTFTYRKRVARGPTH